MIAAGVPSSSSGLDNQSLCLWPAAQKFKPGLQFYLHTSEANLTGVANRSINTLKDTWLMFV